MTPNEAELRAREYEASQRGPKPIAQLWLEAAASDLGTALLTLLKWEASAASGKAPEDYTPAEAEEYFRIMAQACEALQKAGLAPAPKGEGT